MRNQLRSGVVAVVGWFIANCLARFGHPEILGRVLRQPERNRPSDFDESLLQVLNQALRGGHTCLSLASFGTRAEAQLGVNKAAPEAILGALGRLQAHSRIHLTDTHVALTQCAVAEETIAKGLAHIGRRVRPIHPARLSQLLESSTVGLSDEQREAVRHIVNASVSILTGAPGTGKTSTVKALLEMFEQVGCKVRLTAPAGRAAERLREVTGHPAQTLHRMLRANQPASPSIWSRIFPVADVIVVDEASIIDIFLMARLIKACAPSTKLILVGDVNQLPSIGAGQVLFDLIESGTIPVIELRKNFRQTNGSRIIAAAKAIKEGRVPDLPAPGQIKSDCYFIEAGTATEMAEISAREAQVRLQRFTEQRGQMMVIVKDDGAQDIKLARMADVEPRTPLEHFFRPLIERSEKYRRVVAAVEDYGNRSTRATKVFSTNRWRPVAMILRLGRRMTFAGQLSSMVESPRAFLISPTLKVLRGILRIVRQATLMDDRRRT